MEIPRGVEPQPVEEIPDDEDSIHAVSEGVGGPEAATEEKVPPINPELSALVFDGTLTTVFASGCTVSDVARYEPLYVGSQGAELKAGYYNGLNNKGEVVLVTTDVKLLESLRNTMVTDGSKEAEDILHPKEESELSN